MTTLNSYVESVRRNDTQGVLLVTLEIFSSMSRTLSTIFCWESSREFWTFTHKSSNFPSISFSVFRESFSLPPPVIFYGIPEDVENLQRI